MLNYNIVDCVKQRRGALKIVFVSLFFNMVVNSSAIIHSAIF